MVFFIIAFVSFVFAERPVLSSQIVARGLDSPVYLTAPEGEKDTLYVLEQGGCIKKIVSGALIKNSQNISLGYTLGLNLHNKSVRHLDLLNAFDKTYLLVTFNNDAAEVYEILKQ